VLLAVAFVVVVGLVMERIVVRPLLEAPRITVLVATIAFALLSIGIQILLFLPEAKALDPVIPGLDAQGNPRGIEIFNYNLEPQGILVIGVLIAFAAIGAYFFSKTDLGLAVLATSQDPFATRVVGIGVERVSRFIWGSAAFLGAIAGILFVPLAGVLAPGSVTSGVLIPAFTAAVIGGMTSLTGAFVGGIAVGIISQLAEWAAGHYSIGDQVLGSVVPGFSNVALVVALLIVLLVRPAGLLGSEA
jgi:branched-chain amino acid transport system permease protein